MSKTPFGLSHLADRCTSLRQLSQVHAQMLVTARIPSDNYAASRLLSFYATNGHLPLALSLFSLTPSPNSFFFNTLIRASSSSASSAFALYSRMLRSAVSPGKHTFPFLLKASANLGSPSLSKQIHDHVIKYGLELDRYVTNGLTHSYACSGMVVDARKVFDGTTERNSMIWTTMVSGYARNGLADEAIGLFEEMVGLGVELCGATMASVLSACARSGGLETGRRVHGIVKEKGVEVGVILGTALVDMYAKNGAIFEAREVFVGMPERNVATWNAMICGLAHHGHSEGAVCLFRELERLVKSTRRSVSE
ncbi:uncharacterized protein A4U43_C02F4620 [Asparagus officinalis]|uniref:Pentatricopeptide repeat-containing protein n=1 Tax=Asparagus officinalis TaxID=4686 RepID=A0A5P1FKY2_ASPOF|nr:uncharacterized protein A4U43_C02F4620 [Asparagus officinalis]